MRNLEIDQQTTLAHILAELKSTEEDGLELTGVPGVKTILDDPISRTIIDKVGKEYKKTVIFPESPIEAAPEINAENEDDLNFVEGEDVLAKAPMEEVKKIIEPAATPVAAPPLANKAQAGNIFSKLRNKWLIIGAVAVLVLITLVVGLVFLPSAQVRLTLASESKDTQVSILADKTVTEVSVSDNTLPYTEAVVIKEGDDETNATGKKTIGTAAKGRVTIYNQDTDSGKSFLAGTILTPVSAEGVTFKLDSEISLEKAPVSGETTGGVNVTATKVGAEGNLPVGTVFKVGSSNPTFVFAKNDLAFTGGTTKEATVVSQEDRDGLKNKLIEKLSKEAENELEKKTNGSLIPLDGVENKVIKESYVPKNVSAEAEKLTATLELSTKAYLIKEEDLKRLLVGALEKSVGEGLKIAEDKIEVSSQLIEVQAGEKLKLLGKIEASLVPEVTTSQISKRVKGRGVAEVEGYLASIKGVSEYEVIINPFFMRIFRIMPFLGNRINVVIND